MPKVTPGAKTQAAAQKVADSDKPVPSSGTPDEAQQRPIAEVMAENDRKAAERAKTTRSKQPASASTSKPASTTVADSLRKPPSARVTDTSKNPPQTHRLHSLDDDNDFTVLVAYGPAGNRKTTSILRATKSVDQGRILVIAAESGLKRQALQKHGVDTSRVVFWPQRGEPLTYEGLESLFYQILSDFERDPNAWGLVSWDSLTEVIQTLVDNATQADIARMQEIAKAANKKFEVRASFEREGADYQVATQQFRLLLRKWRTLPCHQVFVCLEENRQETIETEDGRKQKVGIIGPALTPAVRQDVEQHADVIMRMTVVDIPGIGLVGLGRSAPAEDLRAKDRYYSLPHTMIDPGFERILGYIRGELKADDDPLQKSVPDVVPELESKSETAERRKAEAAARKTTRTAAKPAPKAQPQSDTKADDSNPM